MASVRGRLDQSLLDPLSVTTTVAAAPVEVVAAVIVQPDGRFLLAQRPPGRVYAGYWEFPGGKVEPDESAEEALQRELHEELGILVTRAWRWITREYVYPHAHVRLHFFRVLGWTGELHSREGQAFAWQRVSAIDVQPVLPANGPILRGLALPPVLAITDAGQRGEQALLDRLDGALEHGLRMVMVREKEMAPERRGSFAADVLGRCRRAGALTLINSDEKLAQDLAADGVHLTAAELARRSHRPEATWCGASCHDEEELQRAAELGLDYVVLGPVLPTASHPSATPLGWARFEAMTRGFPLPVYALGGMALEHFDIACSAGAHGIAMMRGAWSLAPDQSFPSAWSVSGSAVGMR
jgi:8-oxo-dGTP diphosphatase